MPNDARRAQLEDLAAELIEPLRRYLARRTDAATADDVLAETLLVCWRRIDEVPDEALPWAYGVARRCLANAERGARRQRRVAARIAVVDPPSTRTAGPGDGDPAADGAAEVVRRAMAALSPREAELLRLWAWEELGAAEIATVLEITPNAASVRLHRAREKMRGLVGKNAAVAGHEGSKEGRTP